jgi:hypothetical protein
MRDHSARRMGFRICGFSFPLQERNCLVEPPHAGEQRTQPATNLTDEVVRVIVDASGYVERSGETDPRLIVSFENPQVEADSMKGSGGSHIVGSKGSFGDVQHSLIRPQLFIGWRRAVPILSNRHGEEAQGRNKLGGIRSERSLSDDERLPKQISRLGEMAVSMQLFRTIDHGVELRVAHR